MRSFLLALILLTPTLARAQATYKEMLDCVSGTAGARAVDGSTQVSMFASECSAVCPGIAKLAGAGSKEQERIFVSACCGADAAKLLSLPIAERWQKISAACGVPVDPPLASFQWVFFAKANQWLKKQASSWDPRVLLALHDIFATSQKKPLHGFELRLPNAWADHYTLASAAATWRRDAHGYGYVLIDLSGKLFVGRWPFGFFSDKGLSVNRFPGNEVKLSALRRELDAIISGDEYMIPLLFDRTLPSTRVAEVVRALHGRNLCLAVASPSGPATCHSVALEKQATSKKPSAPSQEAIAKQHGISGVLNALSDKEIPSRLGEKVSFKGSVADLVDELDALAKKNVSVGLVE